MTSIASDAEKLYSEYIKLSDAEQVIMELYSIQYFFIYSSQALQILQKLKIHKTLDKYSKEDFEDRIEKLKSKKLLAGRSKGENACNPEVSELITQNSIRKGTFSRLAEEISATSHKRNISDENKLFALARINLYAGKEDIFEGLSDEFTSFRHYFQGLSAEMEEELIELFLNPFSAEFLDSGVIHENYLEKIYISVIFNSVMNSIVSPEAAEYIVKKSLKAELSLSAAGLVYEHLVLQGRNKDAENIFSKYFKKDFGEVLTVSAFKAFVEGNFSESERLYAAETKRIRTATKKKNEEMEGFSTFFYYASLVKLKEYKSAYEYSYKMMNLKYHFNSDEFILLHSFSEMLNGSFREHSFRIPSPERFVSATHWQILIFFTAFYWMELNLSPGHLQILQNWCRAAQSSGYRWFEMQFYDLTAKLTNDAVYSKKAEQIRNEIGSFFISEIYEKKEKWMLALNALLSLNSAEGRTEKINYEKRIAWYIDYNDESGEFSVLPYEQSFNPSKGWTGGRPVALKRLKNEAAKTPYLTEQDIRIISHIRLFSSGHYGGQDAVLMQTAVTDLVGHPHIYLLGTNMHIELQSVNPELRVIRMKNGMFHITMHPPRKDFQIPYSLDPETPTRFRLTVFGQEHDKISQIIGKNGIKVPPEGKNEILNAITSLSSLLTIQSDIGGGEDLNAESVEASAILHIQLIPFSGGVKVGALTRPFGDFGPYCRPGKGGSNLITDHSDRKYHTLRDLQKEESNLNELLKSSPVLNSPGTESDTEWILNDMETCLEVLLELQNMHDKIIIEWPEGEKYRLTGGLDKSKFQIGIRKENDWFSVSGEVKINDDEVIEMQKLLDLLENSPGRFIRMSDGTFMAMTEEFKKQLNDFKNYAESTKDGYRFSPLVAPLLEEMTEGMEKVKADKAWKDHLKKLEDLKNFKPVLPKTFQANLREYQQEGFEWMAKLSKWGVGACLADDMGLGKTIQALAMLLTYAPKGPSLVIAPTSVCMNWHSEAARFAPTLNTIQFGAGDREKIIKNLKSFDLLICSYGMLQQTEAADLLKDTDWKMVILDEAQAVK
ncbi:MAG TPA: SNF2-related protein, partial [Leptospiraceae bacterium]|nr:SNF2-related protein [Leptospiraceae bacterium]